LRTSNSGKKQQAHLCPVLQFLLLGKTAPWNTFLTESTNSPHLMKAEGSRSCSQITATGPCCGPNEFRQQQT